MSFAFIVLLITFPSFVVLKALSSDTQRQNKY